MGGNPNSLVKRTPRSLHEKASTLPACSQWRICNWSPSEKLTDLYSKLGESRLNMSTEFKPERCCEILDTPMFASVCCNLQMPAKAKDVIIMLLSEKRSCRHLLTLG